MLAPSPEPLATLLWEATELPRDARVLGNGGPAFQVTARRANVPGPLEKGRAGEGNNARGPDHASLGRFLPLLVQAPVSPPPPPPATAPPPGPQPRPIAARREPLPPGAGLAQAWRACALRPAPRREEEEEVVEEVEEEEEAAQGNREASRSAGRESRSPAEPPPPPAFSESPGQGLATTRPGPPRRQAPRAVPGSQGEGRQVSAGRRRTERAGAARVA